MDQGITYNPDGTVSLQYEQYGECVAYTGSAPLPDRSTFPMFKTYHEADAYANSAYYDEEVNGEEVDEGLFGSLVGGVAGASIGPMIGRAICKALGITTGILYDLLNSRAFTSAVAAYIGYKN